MIEPSYEKNPEELKALKKVISAVYVHNKNFPRKRFEAATVSRYVAIESSEMRIHLQFLASRGIIEKDRRDSGVRKTYWVDEETKLSEFYASMFHDDLPANAQANIVLGT